jgi:hypothetical protein
VPVVHDAVQTLNGRRRRTHLLAATLICCLCPLAGCGGSGHPQATATAASPSLRLSNCADWQLATGAQRHTIVEQLRRFAGGQVGSSAGIQRGPVLSDDRAYKLLQSYCAKPFARGFKLYKLYTHAAAFIGR